MADVQDYDNGDQMQQENLDMNGQEMEHSDYSHNGNADSSGRDDDR